MVIVAVMTVTCALLLYSRQWWTSNNDSFGMASDLLLHPTFLLNDVSSKNNNDIPDTITPDEGGIHLSRDSLVNEPLSSPQGNLGRGEEEEEEEEEDAGAKTDVKETPGNEESSATSQAAVDEEEKDNKSESDANENQNPESSSGGMTTMTTTEKELGTVVLLAPQRNAGTFWDVDRFCLFIRAVRSVDLYLNVKYGPYPIHVLISKDYQLDPDGKDGPYTKEDRALIRLWAPHSTITFVEVNMYSQDAFEPDVTMEQATQWKEEMPKPFFHGVGYASMCRLWSGRLQQMKFLQRYQYYMRMDDDSLLIETPSFDPFQKMKDQQLKYVYRRTAYDHWGVAKLWEAAKPFVEITGETPFVHNSEYVGMQPYNNFHITEVSFWTSPKWIELWDAINHAHVFFRYRAGDANVHAIACMLMTPRQVAMWSDFPYRHNSNDYIGWAPPEWKQECEAAYSKHLPQRKEQQQQ